MKYVQGKYSDEEREYIKKNFGRYSAKELAANLNRKYASVLQFIYLNKIRSKRKPVWQTRYTEEQLDYVRKWYGKIRLTAIAKNLGVDRNKLYYAILKLGIERHHPTEYLQTHYCRDEIKELIDNGASADEIEDQIGIAYSYLMMLVREKMPEYQMRLRANNKRARQLAAQNK